MRLLPPPDAALASLFDAVKNIQPLPDVVRARVIIRARAVMNARPAAANDVTAGVEEGQPRRRARASLCLLAALLLEVGIGVALAAVGGSVPAPPTAAPASTAPARGEPPPPPARATARRLRAPPRARAVARTPGIEESYAAELALLERAEAMLTAGALSAALAVLTAHAHQFPRGRLAEEREALKVRLLAEAGRTEEERRARGAFAEQYPRSVLLGRLRAAETR